MGGRMDSNRNGLLAKYLNGWVDSLINVWIVI